MPWPAARAFQNRCWHIGVSMLRWDKNNCRFLQQPATRRAQNKKGRATRPSMQLHMLDLIGPSLTFISASFCALPNRESRLESVSRAELFCSVHRHSTSVAACDGSMQMGNDSCCFFHALTHGSHNIKESFLGHNWLHFTSRH